MISLPCYLNAFLLISLFDLILFICPVEKAAATAVQEKTIQYNNESIFFPFPYGLILICVVILLVYTIFLFNKYQCQ
jgi:nucleoside recognition membrane protein YjiH